MYNKYIKRLLDIILSILAIILLSPIIFLLIILGAVFMKGNPFFTQQRPGKDEHIFKLIKFRSMDSSKDKDGRLLPDNIRLNKYGRVLRSTSLDELPELLNILKGDMSFVGPRPWSVSYLNYYTPQEHTRHSVRPGLTGLAQVNGRTAANWDERLKYDIKYVNNITFIGDFRIIFLTVKKVLVRSDIVEAGCQGNFDEYRKKQWSDSTVANPNALMKI
ncbi:MAG: sugar transferase [Lachnospiraceae bacterium]